MARDKSIKESAQAQCAVCGGSAPHANTSKWGHLETQAREYVEGYPADLEERTRLAIYITHLQHLINQEIEELREFGRQRAGMV